MTVRPDRRASTASADSAPRSFLMMCGGFLLAAVAVRAYVLATEHIFYDDAFITLRFAENLIRYGSFSYNPGEVVYGASSPLFTIILAFFALVLPPAALPLTMQVLSIAFLLVAALLLALKSPFTLVSRAFLLVVVLAYPRLFYSSLGGMEETMIVALMVWSALALHSRSVVQTGVALGLMTVVKIDTLLWTVIVLGCGWVLTKRLPRRQAGIALAVSLPWFIYSLFSFSTIIPHTVAAKRIAYPLDHLTALWDILKLSTPEGMLGSTWAILSFGTLPYLLLIISIVLMIRRKDWWAVTFPLYCAGYVATLILSGTSSGLWARWTVPMWLALIVSAGYCVNVAVERFPGLNADSLTPARAWIVGILGCLSLSIPVLYQYHRVMDLNRYERVGEWLQDHASPGSRVILEPIGIIGYRSHLYIHDFIGLVSPDITQARERAGRDDAWFAAYLREKVPDYVILREEEVKTNRFLYGGYGGEIFNQGARAWFDSCYVGLERFSDPTPAISLIVFGRRSPAAR